MNNWCVRRVIFVIFVIFVPDITLLFASDEDHENALQMQLECEKYREGHFQQGDFLVRITTIDEGADGKRFDGDSVLHRVRFDRECIRMDILEGLQLTRVALCDGKYTWETVSELPVVVAPLKEYADPFRNFGLYHPRWIGMGFNDVQSLGHGREFRCFNIPESGPVNVSSIEKEMLDGVEVWKVRFVGERLVDTGRLIEEFNRRRSLEGPFGGVRNDKTTEEQPASATVGFSSDSTQSDALAPANPQDVAHLERFNFEKSYWFAPSQGNALLRCFWREQYPERNVDTIQELNAKYAHDGASDTWYVKMVETSLTSRGRLDTARRYDVEAASFVRPDPQTFEVAGFSLSMNRRVSDRTAGRSQEEFFWNGKELVRIPSVADAVEPVLVQSSTGKRLILILNAIALIAFAFYLFRRKKA